MCAIGAFLGAAIGTVVGLVLLDHWATVVEWLSH